LGATKIPGRRCERLSRGRGASSCTHSVGHNRISGSRSIAASADLPRSSVLGLTRCLGGGGRRVRCAFVVVGARLGNLEWVQCNVLGARTTTHVLVSFLFRSCFLPSFLLLAPPDGRSSAHALAMGAAPCFLGAFIGVLVYSVAPRRTVDAAHRLDSGGAPHRFSFSFKFMYCPNTPRASGPGRLPCTQPHCAFFFLQRQNSKIFSSSSPRPLLRSLS
jgi:hypothetical protein